MQPSHQAGRAFIVLPAAAFSHLGALCCPSLVPLFQVLADGVVDYLGGALMRGRVNLDRLLVALLKLAHEELIAQNLDIRVNGTVVLVMQFIGLIS